MTREKDYWMTRAEKLAIKRKVRHTHSRNQEHDLRKVRNRLRNLLRSEGKLGMEHPGRIISEIRSHRKYVKAYSWHRSDREYEDYKSIHW